jgi:hypothetical protein
MKHDGFGHAEQSAHQQVICGIEINTRGNPGITFCMAAIM